MLPQAQRYKAKVLTLFVRSSERVDKRLSEVGVSQTADRYQQRIPSVPAGSLEDDPSETVKSNISNPKNKIAIFKAAKTAYLMTPSPVTLRDALEDDLPQILDIYNDVILNTTAVYSEQPYTLEMRQVWFNERKASGFPVIVAEQDGMVAGFATYGHFRVWPCYRFTVEHSVYVHVGNRGQGISNILLNEIIDHAKKAGMHALIAGVDSENDISLKLHFKFGFTQVARFKEVGYKFNRWLDLIFLELILRGD